ncbi:MAG: BON domain-containing protein [Thermomicrobiales bacterium]
MVMTMKTHKSDVEIQRDVMDEIDWDPEVEVTDVGVEVDDGVVTLTGTVDHYATKQAAERAAFQVDGVRAVANDITIHAMWDDARTDTDVAKAVANVLEYNTTIPAGAIDTRVANHWVTLTGEVNWDFQRQAAEKAVKRIHGVTGVFNSITVKQPQVSATEVKDGIARALVRSAEIDAAHISVDVHNGQVTLRGTVQSWAERQEAQSAAWKARGVTMVRNEIAIQPK